MRHQEVFTGRIGRVNDIQELNNGNCVVNFSVAETPRFKKGDEWVDGTTIWTNCAIFGDEARNLHRSVKPGTFVTVIGTRRANEYTPKDSTETQISQQVVVDQVSVAITKFDYIETLGNVNYSEAGRGGGGQQGGQQGGQAGGQQSSGQYGGQQSTGQPTGQSQAQNSGNADPFGNDDPFGDSDPFGGSDDDPFNIGG